MSKELEALEEIRDFRYGEDKLLVCQTEMYSTIKQALQRLESIDNANPSEALKSLENLSWFKSIYDTELYVPDTEEYNTIKQALLKAQEQEKENARLKSRIQDLEKDLEEQRELAKHYLDEQEKTLKIIKEKDVDIYILRNCKTVDEYNSKIVHIIGETRELTEEEFDLLKEML